MQSRIARARDRSPSCPRAIHKDDMVKEIDRLESKNEWWITMLLENSRGKECRFETMSSSCSNDSSKTAHGVAGGFSVVWQVVQPSLNRSWSFQLVDEPSLNRCKRQTWRSDPGGIRKPHVLQCFSRAQSLASGAVAIMTCARADASSVVRFSNTQRVAHATPNPASARKEPCVDPVASFTNPIM